MAKRFTATTKWEDSWFLDLNPGFKCAWIYMLDRCDSAGVWEVNAKLMAYLIGQDLPWEKVKEIFGSRLIEFTPGKVWIRKFIDFQYGELSLTCKPHLSVINSLKRYGLWETYQETFKGYPKGIQRDKEEEQEQDKEEDQDLGKGSAEGKPQTAPPPSLPVTSSEAVAHAAFRKQERTAPGQPEYDRALRVLEAYPVRAKKDGRVVKKDLAAQNLLARKIFDTPAFPWEEAAALEAEGDTPQDLGAWVAVMPDPIKLAAMRKAAQTPLAPKPGERPVKKLQALND